MNRVVRAVPWAALVAAACAALPLSSADDQQPPAPTVEQLVRDLGSPVFSTRERAGEQLWKRGRDAIPALEKATADPNPEVARRARVVLDRFGWYVFPDTPADVLKQLAAFRTGTPTERKAAFAELLKLGPHGRAAARAVLLKDLPAATRDPLAAYLTTLLRREVPLLLFDGKADEAAGMLALHSVGTTPEGAADHAVFQVLRGTLPAAIAEAEAARASARKPEAADLLLAHLYRANRDWAKARSAAAVIDRANADRAANDPNHAGGPGLVETLLEDEGNWPTLLAAPPAGPHNLPDAYRLTLLRLSGKAQEFAAEAKRVCGSAGELASGEDVRDVAFSLLLNNRAADATNLLLDKRQNLDLLAELLIAGMRYKDALDWIATEKGWAPDEQRMEFNHRRARVLAIVGRRDEAVKLFTDAVTWMRSLPTSGLAPSPPPALVRALLRSELRVGLRDLACDHAALFLPGQKSPRVPDQGETVFDLLFGADASTAEFLYWALRASHPAEPIGVAMRGARDLLNGTAPKDAADAAIKQLSQEGLGEAGGGQPDLDRAARQRRVARMSALAAVCRGAKRDAEAETAFAAAAEAAADGPELVGARSWVFGLSDAARPWLEYADFLADRGRHAEAAAKFEAGWKRFPDQPLLLFLSGRALVNAGSAAEGRRRMELAHWVALGNEKARGKFLEELVRRGEAKAAARETDLLLRACWSRDFYFGNVMNQAARAAALAKDWPTAERCVQRSLLVLIKTPGVQYVDVSAYLLMPHEMQVFRARGLLAAGKVDEAMAQARACLDVTPGHVELAAGMVPELEKRGRKTEADELYGRVRDAYRKVRADYPASAVARNSLATLAAGCRRDLDGALVYAKEAVAADPTATAFRETLAEVHFRRGERGAALAVMAKLAGENPRSRLYRRQLARYRSGDVASPTPDAEDD